ncbi:MmpS family transport accessory protein [Amycolatopsis sp. NPDC059021]|uniref:MmpS family transport accessory protein n=1 Tax=Amycolatopsis sp. NPDC059021 TaxID=3346704 RepID=UPI00366ACE72
MRVRTVVSPPPSSPGSPGAARVPGGAGRDRSLGNVVVVLGVAAVAIALAWYVMPKTASRPSAPPPEQARAAPAVAAKPVSHAVVYELTGGHGARNLTYVGAGTDLVQSAEVSTPWSMSFTRTGPADQTEFYSVSAQNAGTGTLRCRILVDGVVVAEKTVTGEDRQLTCTA